MPYLTFTSNILTSYRSNEMTIYDSKLITGSGFIHAFRIQDNSIRIDGTTELVGSVYRCISNSTYIFVYRQTLGYYYLDWYSYSNNTFTLHRSTLMNFIIISPTVRWRILDIACNDDYVFIVGRYEESPYTAPYQTLVAAYDMSGNIAGSSVGIDGESVGLNSPACYVDNFLAFINSQSGYLNLVSFNGSSFSLIESISGFTNLSRINIATDGSYYYLPVPDVPSNPASWDTHVLTISGNTITEVDIIEDAGYAQIQSFGTTVAAYKFANVSGEPTPPEGQIDIVKYNGSGLTVYNSYDVTGYFYAFPLFFGAVVDIENDRLFVNDIRREATPTYQDESHYISHYSVSTPIISQPTVDVQAYVGSTATMCVGATGTNVLYQWYSIDNLGATGAIAGATGSCYTTPVLYSSDNGSSYFVVVTPDDDPAIYSDTVNLTVTSALSIVFQPSSVVIYPGETAAFSAGVTGYQLQFQWYQNDGGVTGAIAGETGSSYIKNFVRSDDPKSFYLKVFETGSNGTVWSNVADLGVTSVFGIVNQPVDFQLLSGETGYAEVGVTGWVGGISYQWYKIDGGVTGTIVGQTSNRYYYVGDLADTGDGFMCAVTETGTSTLYSSIADVTVGIEYSPTGPFDQYYTNGNTVTFDVSGVTGTGPYTYQWAKWVD